MMSRRSAASLKEMRRKLVQTKGREVTTGGDRRAWSGETTVLGAATLHRL